MKKHWRFKLTVIAAILLFGSLLAANAGGIWNRGTHTIEALWNIIGAGEIRMKDGSELRFDSGSTLTLTNAGTITASGLITATHIANVTREIYLPMAGWAIDGGDDIDDGSTPDIGDDDNIPSITWDNSGEVVAIQATFRLPATYVSGLTIYALISSDTDASGDNSQGLDWRIWTNRTSTTFDAAAIAQTGAFNSTGIPLDASHEVLTLTLDATGEAAVAAGDFITVDLFNATVHASANTELKGTHGTFTATQ